MSIFRNCGLTVTGRRQQPGGIFNQRQEDSIWNEESTTPAPPSLRDHLLQQSAPQSRPQNTSTLLAQMYRPPFEIMYKDSWEEARAEGKEDSKWLLVNIQDSTLR